MFRKLFFFIIVNLALINVSFANLEIKARTAILQDFYSGEILYEVEPDRSIYPASMTKIMTSIIAFSETINVSSRDKSPDLIKSKAIIEVIIFVIDAG